MYEATTNKTLATRILAAATVIQNTHVIQDTGETFWPNADGTQIDL